MEASTSGTNIPKRARKRVRRNIKTKAKSLQKLSPLLKIQTKKVQKYRVQRVTRMNWKIWRDGKRQITILGTVRRLWKPIIVLLAIMSNEELESK